jgi:hypothetical protein
MHANPIQEYTLQSRYHSTCAECKCGIKPGDAIRYLPKDEQHGRLKPVVRHAEGKCPAVMDYTVQLVYRATSKLVHIRALSATEALDKAKPKRIAREVDMPCGYVVRQGNIEVLRRVA